MFNTIAHHGDLFNAEARWNYFESGHGKGPCDGIGGTTKRMAADAIKQRKATIQDAYDLYDWAHKNEKSVAYHFYSRNEYNSAALFLEKSTPKVILGTMKIHAVYSRVAGQIYVQGTSCYCNGCLDGSALCDGWVKHVVDRLEAHNLDAAEMQVTEEPAADASHTDTTCLIPTIAAFVGAKYESQWYIGKVLEVDHGDQDALVSFMTNHENKGRTQLKWPEKSDEIWVSFQDIIAEVEEPLAVGRSKRFYEMSDSDLQLILNKVGFKY